MPFSSNVGQPDKFAMVISARWPLSMHVVAGSGPFGCWSSNRHLRELGIPSTAGAWGEPRGG